MSEPVPPPIRSRADALEADDADPLAFAEVAGWWRALGDPDAPDAEVMVARTQLRALADQWLVERRFLLGDLGLGRLGFFLGVFLTDGSHLGVDAGVVARLSHGLFCPS